MIGSMCLSRSWGVGAAGVVWGGFVSFGDHDTGLVVVKFD